MNYWHGIMDWPVDSDWKCEVCLQRSALIWGLRHAECRCSVCHTQYYMRDSTEENKMVTRPINTLKDEYFKAFKSIYAKTPKKIQEVEDAEWEAEGIKP